ncbi:MAG: hypothetical protein KDB80_08855 [Planctomycetes bacterium]|nr:hypothetical protein [Planctomycetota bacterium]
MNRTLLLISVLAVPDGASSQQVTIPSAAVTVEGASSATIPPFQPIPWAPTREMYVIENAAFASFSNTISITGIGLRADGGFVTGPQSFSPLVFTTLSTSPTPLVQTSIDANHGADAREFTAVGSLQATSGSTPNDDLFHVTFDPPFVFDPTLGSRLLIEFDWLGQSPPVPVLDIVPNAAHVTRFREHPGSGLVVDQDAPVITLDYLPGGYATVEAFGSGCGQHLRSLVESFHAVSNPVDLQRGSGWRATPMGTGYAVAAGSSAYVPPASTPLAFAAGSVEQVALPWVIPHPGGVTQSLWIDFAGSIALEPIGPAGGRYTWAGAVTVFPLWAGFPLAHGTVHAELDPTNANRFHVTWVDAVQGLNHRNTFQATIERSGAIEVKYEAVDVPADAIVGITPGHGALRLDADLSLEVARGWLPGSDTRRVELVPATPGARPVMGSTFGLTTNALPPAVHLGWLMLSFRRLDPVVDLTVIGMRDCRLYTGATLGPLPLALPSVTPLPIPTSAAFAGRTLYAQLAVVGFPTPNPLPIATSNGLAMTIQPN